MRCNSHSSSLSDALHTCAETGALTCSAKKKSQKKLALSAVTVSKLFRPIRSKNSTAAFRHLEVRSRFPPLTLPRWKAQPSASVHFKIAECHSPQSCARRGSVGCKSRGQPGHCPGKAGPLDPSKPYRRRSSPGSRPARSFHLLSAPS